MADFRAAVRARLRHARHREAVLAEIVEEVASHLDDVYRAALAAGSPPERAESTALAELEDTDALLRRLPRGLRRAAPMRPWKRGSFGVGVPSLRDRLESILGDVRHGLRVMRRRPLFTVAALLTLALGVGANSALFSIVYGVLLRPLPWDDPDRLVRLARAAPAAADFLGPLTDAEFERIAQLDAVESAAAYGVREIRVQAGDNTIRLEAVAATAAFDSLLGLRPDRGRWLAPRSEAPEIVLASRAAIRLFGSIDAAAGEQLSVEGEPHTVVGVLPDHAAFPPRTQAWLLREPLTGDARGMRFATLHGLARVPVGSSGELANALDAVAAAIVADRGGSEFRYAVVPLREHLIGDVAPILYRFGLGMALALLIACANVGNLLLEQSGRRRGERAIRSALGAGRSRLVRQSLVESLLLGGLGALLGGGLAWGAVRAFVALNPLAVPRVHEIRVDLPVLAFTLVVGLASGILCGLVPAIRSGRPGLAAVLAESEPSNSRGWAGSMLTVAEIAMSLALLVGAGLLAHSFVRMARIDPGYVPERLIAARFDFGGMSDPDSANQGVAEAVGRFAAIPGVERVAFTETPPPERQPVDRELMIEGHQLGAGDARPRAQVVKVGHGYFEALGLRILEGRPFTASDVTDERRIAIVNGAFTRRFLRDGPRVGRRVLLGGQLVEVVGVVADARLGDVREPPVPMLYRPGQRPVSAMTMGTSTVRFATDAWLVIRVGDDPARVAARVRDVARALPDSARVEQLQIVGDRLWQSLAAPRFLAAAVGGFALAGALLAAIGVYAVVACAVRRASHELGVRIALGATPPQILRRVMVDGLTTVAIGLAVGAGLALLLTRSMQSFLYDVETTDITTYAAVTVLLGLVAVAATYIPARRAVSIDPVEIFRRAAE